MILYQTLRCVTSSLVTMSTTFHVSFFVLGIKRVTQTFWCHGRCKNAIFDPIQTSPFWILSLKDKQSIRSSSSKHSRFWVDPRKSKRTLLWFILQATEGKHRQGLLPIFFFLRLMVGLDGHIRLLPFWTWNTLCIGKPWYGTTSRCTTYISRRARRKRFIFFRAIHQIFDLVFLSACTPGEVACESRHIEIFWGKFQIVQWSRGHDYT